MPRANLRDWKVNTCSHLGKFVTSKLVCRGLTALPSGLVFNPDLLHLNFQEVFWCLFPEL